MEDSGQRNSYELADRAESNPKQDEKKGLLRPLKHSVRSAMWGNRHPPTDYSHDSHKSTSREDLEHSATDVHDGKASRVTRFRRQHALAAWRLALSSGTAVGVLVLLNNLIILIVVVARYQLEDGVATVWTGDCGRAAGTVTALHFLINILSSLLLAASNFSMQCLSAPTRAEVDRAHAEKRWLSIATPNLRNLMHVSPLKSLVWFLLALSSFPLHLLWNSVVFETRTTNEYYAIKVSRHPFRADLLTLNFSTMKWFLTSPMPDLKTGKNENILTLTTGYT